MASSAARAKSTRTDHGGWRGPESRAPYQRSHVPPGAARPLPRALADDLGLRFNADFRSVRVHEGTEAQAHAEALDARAYTVGEDIVLGRKAPPLSSDGGKRTLAHELAHVVQQRRGGPPPAMSKDAPHEAAADRAASAAMSGSGAVAVAGATGVGVARDADEDAIRKRNKARSKLKGVSKDVDKDVEQGIVEEPTPQGKAPSQKPRKVPSTKEAKDARTKFSSQRDKHAAALGVAKGKGGQVHHGIELQALKRYPGAFTSEELNARENMRGIRPELEGKRQLHNSKIREAWDRHYNKLDALIKKNGLKKGTLAYREFARKYLLEALKEMDYLYDQLYSEARLAEAAKSGKEPAAKQAGGRAKSPGKSTPPAEVGTKKSAAPKSATKATAPPKPQAKAGKAKAPAKAAAKSPAKSAAKTTPAPKQKGAAPRASTRSAAKRASAPGKAPRQAPVKAPTKPPQEPSAKAPSAAQRGKGTKAPTKAAKAPATPPKTATAPATPTKPAKQAAAPAPGARTQAPRKAPPPAPKTSPKTAPPEPAAAPPTNQAAPPTAKAEPPTAKAAPPTAKAAPKAAPPAAKATAKTPPPAKVVPKAAPTKPGPKVGPSPKGGTAKGTAGGLLGMGLQIAASEYHERAVEQRIEKKAQEKGYAPYGGPSGEGVLYDIGSWLLDPFNDADKKVPIDRRFNVSVWRANLRKVANEKKPGETIEFTWQVGLNKFDFWGNQEIEDVQVVYRKGDDGRWTPVSGARSDIPDFNKIISTEVPDSEIEMRLQQGPTTA